MDGRRRKRLTKPRRPHSHAANRLRRREPEHLNPTLTGRQCEVLRLVLAGEADGAIGRELHIAPVTVRAHVAHAMAALGARNRAELAAIVTRGGLI